MLRSFFRGLVGGRDTDASASAQVPPPSAQAASPRELGDAALAAGRLDEAARCYGSGLAQQPGDAWMHRSLGLVLLQQGRFEPAARSLRQALALRRPGDGVGEDAFYFLGCAEGGLGQLQAALASFESALRVRPDFPEALDAAARAGLQLGRVDAALAWTRRLAELRPDTRSGILLGRALLSANHAQEAAAMLEGVCARAPSDLDAAFLRYQCLEAAGDLAAALAQGERVLELTGPDPRAFANLAAILHKLDRLDEALERAEQALRLDPRNAGALLNRVAVLLELGRVEQARDAARAALALHPQDSNLHWNLGFALLLLGEFREGWAEHEWRLGSQAIADEVLYPERTAWRGEDLAGRTLLVHGEQGFGDNLQFVRYVPELAARAGAVLLQMPEALRPLLLDLAPNCRLLAPGELLPAFDFHCSVMSLPARVGTSLETIPAAVPYLRADPSKVQAWGRRLPKGRPNVGIAWSGKPTYANDGRRSMRLETFRAAFTDSCQFVTLQPQLAEADRVTLAQHPEVLDLGRDVRDFGDTAALMQALDLVVTTDTSVAHLAGALGRPVWILLAHVPDWRWMLEGERSPWYPTARLFRQPARRDWAAVLAKVRAELDRLAATAPA